LVVQPIVIVMVNLAARIGIGDKAMQEMSFLGSSSSDAIPDIKSLRSIIPNGDPGSTDPLHKRQIFGVY
jgi:hypothetical protein